MGRKAKKCPKNCLKHLFVLKPVHYSAFFSRESSTSFCPQNLTSDGTYPKFNRDRKHYTASFILATDQIKIINNNDAYMAEHERFKKQQNQQIAEIMIPKPKDKHSYCNVCKQVYDDYQEHIYSQKHKEFIENNSFNKDLKELCSNYFVNELGSDRSINHDEIENIEQKKFINENSQTIQGPLLQSNEIELPELLFQIRSTRQSLEGLNGYKKAQSFHHYQQDRDCIKFENQQENNFQNNFFQHSVFKQINENYFIPNYGCFKNIDQTASPVKSRFGKPIILTNTIGKLDQ